MRAVALAALAFVLAACGGADVGAGPASSAGLLGPGAVVYWQTVTDPESPQWKQAEELLLRFPDGEKWIEELKQQIADDGVDWDADVRPALGSVVDVAVYVEGGKRAVVALTNSTDKAKAHALIDKLDAGGHEKAVVRDVGGWIAVSDSQAAIDAALKEPGGRSLAADDAFTSAMDDLPDDALSRVYVDPGRALDLVPPGMERKALAMLGLDDLDFAGAWAETTENGARIALALRGEGADRLLGTGDPYTSHLLEKVPEDAFAFLSFQGGGLSRQLQNFRGNPLFDLGLQDFEQELGIDVDELLSVLDGEVALYARPAVGPIPEITLLLDSKEPVQAKASLEKLAARLSEALHVRLTVGSTGGTLVVSTSKSAVVDLEEAAKLPDSSLFEDALDAAGAPEQYTGLAWVNMAKAVDLIRAYLGFGGEQHELPPELSRNLEPLKSFVAFGEQAGGLSTAQAFLEIK